MPTELLTDATEAADPPGTLGDEQSDDPVALAEWLAAFDALPALVAEDAITMHEVRSNNRGEEA